MILDINLNVNVNFSADKTLVDAIVYAGGWAANLYQAIRPHATKPPITKEDVQALKDGSAYAGKTEQEPTEKSPVAAQEPVETKDASVSTQRAEKTAESAKLKAETPAADPNAKVTGDALVALRAAVMAFGTADTTGGNRDKLSAWLREHDLQKVPDATNAQAAELLEFINKEESRHA